MSTELMRVDFTSKLRRDLKSLAKKYRNIYTDIQPIFDQLSNGEIIGDHVPGTQRTIFKIRVLNSDIQKGKRSGYRVIYNLKTNTYIIIVTVYSKLEQSNISPKEIRDILDGFDKQ